MAQDWVWVRVLVLVLVLALGWVQEMAQEWVAGEELVGVQELEELVQELVPEWFLA
jgi:hypothetical protein